MEPTLLVVAALLGAAAWAAGFAAPPGDTAGAAPPRKLAAIWLPAVPGLIAFALALPSKGVFQPGLGLGLGALIGGILGALGLWIGRRSASAIPGAGLALLAVALPFWLLRGSLLDALSGVALGWIAAFVTDGAVMAREEPRLSLAGLAAPALAIALSLGVLRGDANVALPKDAFAIGALTLAAAPIALLALGRAARGDGRVWSAVAAVGFCAALYLMQKRLPFGWGLWAVGLGGAALSAAIQTAVPRGDRTFGLVAALTVLAGEMVAAHWMEGFGAGVFALSVLVGALIVAPKRPEPGSVALAALLALTRLATVRWSVELRGFGLVEQYGLLGALCGALLPQLCAALARREPRVAFALPLAALPLLTVPLAGGLLYGPRVGAAFLTGLAIAAAPGALHRRLHPRTALLALAAGLAAVQLSGRVDHWADAARKVRVQAALALIAAPIVLGVAAEATRRRKP
jgi:hypothetical protein